MAAEIQYSVPKREPCTICNYPVFLAERFKIGRRLYHRTCLKCVHCKEQLTHTDLEDLDETAGFIVSEFTCETCQDRIINESLAPIKGDDSIFNDLDDGGDDDALFDELVDEQLPPVNVLKRSLSDEEKTQSLKLSNKKTMSAMNDFMSAHFVDEAPSNHDHDHDQALAPAAKVEVSELAPSGSTPRSGQFDSGIVVAEVVEKTSLAPDRATSNSPSPVDVVLADDDENAVAPAINEHTFPHAQRTEPKVDVAPVQTAQPIAVEESDSETESESSESSEEEEEESRGDSPDNNEVSNYTKACTLKLPVAGQSEKPKAAGRDYPVDLNPFGEAEEEEEDVVAADRSQKPAQKPTPVKRGTNPFGSESEEEEEVKQPKPTPPKVTKSTNPFGSDDDEDVDNAAEAQIVAKRMPIPTPRKSQPSNEPSSFLSLSTADVSSFRGSSCSLNSNTSSVSTPRRLKGKAPPPPRSFVSSTPSNPSPSPSKATLVRPRKSRPAPQPPVDQMDSLTLSTASLASTSSTNSNSVKRLIPLDASLIDVDRGDVRPAEATHESFYRRQITPLSVEEVGQPEKLKDNKDAKNRDRQSGASFHESQYLTADMAISMRRPSAEKRAHRKGAAPMAVPPKRIPKMLPLQDIREELEVIEIQHQGLEKQGVILEKMIRERCERPPETPADNQAATDRTSADYTNSVDVDDLIMQLFEIVNEKNELFRRQAELMYLRRSHRLEQEQADLEYEIRKSMAQPERNKTDTDKTREENLIARLVEVVQQRNEIIECLEMDRVREREEDTSIQTEKERHAAKRDEEYSKHTLIKLSKKEKKSLKETKKFFLRSSKKVDTEKETDETEPAKVSKKKKKKFIF